MLLVPHIGVSLRSIFAFRYILTTGRQRRSWRTVLVAKPTDPTARFCSGLSRRKTWQSFLQRILQNGPVAAISLHAKVLSCFCLVLSCLELIVIVSCRALSCLVVPCLVLSCLVLSCSCCVISSWSCLDLAFILPRSCLDLVFVLPWSCRCLCLLHLSFT